MPYRTGRSRTLSCSGSFTGDLFLDTLGAHYPSNPARQASYGIQFFTGRLQANTDFGGAGNPTLHLVAQCTSNTQSGTFTFPVNTVQDLAGSFTISVAVEEWVDYSFSGWNGLEAPETTYCRFYEQVVTGANLTASITCAGHTMSVTDTTVSGRMLAVSADYDATFGVNGYGNQYTTENASLTYSYSSATLPVGYSRSVPNNSVSAGGSSLSISCSHDTNINGTGVSVTVAPPKGYSISGIIRTFADSYSRTMGLLIDRASDDNGHHFDAAGGSFSDANTQYRYSVNSNMDTVAQPSISADTFGNLVVSARPGSMGDGDLYSLLANGEDTRNTRVLMRGHSFNAFTVAQASTTTVDDGSSLAPAAQPYAGTWTGGAHTTVSLSSGIRAVVAGGTGSLVRAFTPRDAGLSGYAGLRIYLTASADGSPLRVTIGSKVWTADYLGAALVAGTTAGGSVLLNLCAPQSATASTDATDTKWPLPTTDGPYWGVTAAPSITIDNLADGKTYTVQSVALEHLPGAPHSRMTFLPSFDNWVLEVPATVSGDTTTTNYALLGMDGDTDGRRSVEELCARKTVVVTPTVTTTSYGDIPLSAWADILGHNAGNPLNQPNPVHAGWLSSGAAGTTDPANGGAISAWLNGNRPSVWAWGGGALYRAGAWSLGIDVDCSSAQVVYGQTMFDTLDWYPGAGDVFSFDAIGTGNYGASTTVFAAHFLRGQGFGHVLNTDGSLVSGQAVTATDTGDMSNAGSTTTGAGGEYVTGSPEGRGLHSIKVSTPVANYTRAWSDRHRWRLTLSQSTVQPLINPFSFVDAPGIPNYHASMISGRKAQYSRSVFQSFSGGWEVERVNVFQADGSHIVSDLRVVRDLRLTMIAVYTVSANDGTSPVVYRATSDDDGATWGTGVSIITGGKHPTIAFGNDGVFAIEVVAAYTGAVGGPGTITAVKRTSGEAAFGASFVFVDHTGANIAVADDTFHIQQVPDGSTRWALHCLENGAGVTSHWESYDDLLSWTKVG